MKRQVYSDYGTDVKTASLNALTLMRESFTRPDFKEGVQSFLEKRQPDFPPVNPNI
jgi:enoyl-CoA hydratase/carnithine racemase